MWALNLPDHIDFYSFKMFYLQFFHIIYVPISEHHILLKIFVQVSVLLHWAVSSFTLGNGPRAWHIESVHENFTGFRSFSNNFNFYTCF